jgi:oligopeptide transport system substrate-binding protein
MLNQFKSSFCHFSRRLNMIREIHATIYLSLLACFCGCSYRANPTDIEVLQRGLGGEPSALDPAAAADNFSLQVVQDLYEGLTTESASGDPLPGVASSWQIDSSGTLYTFQLRSSARWSNGAPVLAKDFVAAWQRVVDPREASPVADNLRLIAGAADIIAGHSPPSTLGVLAQSDHVLTVKLERPAPFFPHLLTHPSASPIYSAASARSHDPATWVSNGAYVLTNWQPGTKVELTRNMNYWDRDNVHIPRVQYQITTDDNSQYARYRAGQLDITDSVPVNAIPSLRTQHSTELFIAPFLATAYYGLNLSKPPFAHNIDLRRALALAIDRKQLVNSLAFGQSPAYGFVPPGTWNYQPQYWEWRELNDIDRIAQAKQFYKRAGYSADHPLHVRLLINANGVIKNTAILIASMWKDTLGIDTELTEEEYRVFLQSRHDKKRWDVARLGWTADFNDASNFLDIFRSHSPSNDVEYNNPNFDKLANDAANTPDAMRRRTLLESSEHMMLEDYPVIPLYFFVSKRLVKPYIIGVRPNPLNRLPSKTLTIVAH